MIHLYFSYFAVLFCSFNLMTWQLQPLLSIYLRVWGHTLNHVHYTRSYICEETLLYSEDIFQLILFPQWGVGLMYPCLFHTRRLAALILCRQPQPLWVYRCSSAVISRRLSLIQLSIHSKSYSFSAPLLWWFLSLEGGCDIDVIHVADCPTLICSLNFDQLWISLFITIHCRINFFDEAWGCTTLQVERCKLNWHFDTLSITKMSINKTY